MGIERLIIPLTAGLLALTLACSDDVTGTDSKLPPDYGVPDRGSDYRTDVSGGSDGSDGGDSSPDPDAGEDVGLNCSVTFAKMGGAFAAVCKTAKATCYGNQVKYGVKTHDLVMKNGFGATFVCSSLGLCTTNETLDNPQKYSVTFEAKGGSKSCGTHTVTGEVK